MGWKKLIAILNKIYKPNKYIFKPNPLKIRVSNSCWQWRRNGGDGDEEAATVTAMSTIWSPSPVKLIRQEKRELPPTRSINVDQLDLKIYQNQAVSLVMRMREAPNPVINGQQWSMEMNNWFCLLKLDVWDKYIVGKKEKKKEKKKDKKEIEKKEH